MIIHNCEQQSEEWFIVRKGKVTASHATAIANCGKGLETEIINTMAKYFSSGEDERFSSKETDRGNELEPISRSIYELQTGKTVEKVGFIEYNEFVGCSPDGLIDDDGGYETKSPNDAVYFKLLMEGEKAIPSDYVWQVQMNLLITGRTYWDLMFYNPNFKKSFVIFRILPDQEKFKSLFKGFILAETMIRTIKANYAKMLD